MSGIGMEGVMKFRLVIVCFIAVLMIGSVAPTRVIAQRETKGIPPTWTQVNSDGFGEYNWQIPSLAVFGRYLYAGTWYGLWVDEFTFIIKAQIWRTEDAENWVKVFEADENGAAALVVFKDYLYCGSWGPKIWRSKDGVNWEEVVSDGVGVARMAVSDNTLYTSTWGGKVGTEIWRTTNGTEWVQVDAPGLSDDPNNNGAIASEEFKGDLYWGVVNTVTGAQLWKGKGDQLTPVITDGFGTPDNGVISALSRFGNYLYAGVGSPSGVTVWRSHDGKNWNQVFISDPENIGSISALEVYLEQLYVVLQDYASGVEVYRTANGTDWEQVGFDGFGDVNNVEAYWDNGMTIFRDRLYVGLTNWWTAGEVWEMCIGNCK